MQHDFVIDDMARCLDELLAIWDQVWMDNGETCPEGLLTLLELLATSHEHLVGVRILALLPNAPDAAVVTLARSVVETAARAWWLLDAEDGDAQTARIMLENRHAIREASRLRDSLGSSFEAPEHMLYRERAVEEILDQLAFVDGWEITASAIRGEKRPSQGEVMKRLFDATSEEAIGAGIYHLAAGVAHGQLGAVDLLGNFEPTRGSRARPDTAAYAGLVPTMVGIAGHAFWAVLARASEALGWGYSWERARPSALQDLRQRTAVAATLDGSLGRNEPCPCGSGRRFKYCHGAT